MNRLLFPTTLSTSFYDIGKYVGLRTYQHPLVTYISYTPTGENLALSSTVNVMANEVA
jgi:hypothetical protein